MIRAWLHNRMPRSLLARAALILLLPLVLLQVIVSIGFVQRYYEDVTRQMTAPLVLELAFLSDLAARAPDVEAAREAVLAVAGPLDLATTLPAADPPQDSVDRWDLQGQAMASTLRSGLPGLRAVASRPSQPVAVWIDTPHGVLQVEFARRRVSASAPHQLLVLTIGTGLLLATISWIFLRNQMRPIRRLAEAATDYGRGRIVPFRPSGATEVRAAGAAFLDMRARIERQTQSRTAMLAGISHDLRTPLTRLKLGLSMIEDEDAQELIRDVDAMSRMVDAFLAFARGDAEDRVEATELGPLVAEVVEGFRRQGHAVDQAETTGAEGAALRLRPLAIRRALENLLANALAHGSRARVTLAFGEKSVRLSVEDDGPGIPPDRREDAVRPFVRLDDARNQDQAGVGLGLAIVADVARAHGGALRLGQSDMGGLRADLVLSR
jgi:two-component system osmolarity sensor histidine kinase EnvZ